MHESHTPGHKFNATAPQTWAYSVAPTRHDILCRLQAGALGVAMQSPPRGRRGFSADFPRILRGFSAGANVQLYRVKLQKHTRGFSADLPRIFRGISADGPSSARAPPRILRGSPAAPPRILRGSPAAPPRIFRASPADFWRVPGCLRKFPVRWPRGIP